MEKKISGIICECCRGDIARQFDFCAIVNAACASLSGGGGVDGAIHRVAGPELKKESIPLGPIKPGEAVITSAYRLPNRYVIHCLGPVYGRDNPADKLLAACYHNALDLAEKYGIDSIVFPAISTGAFGYPKLKAANVAIGAVFSHIRSLNFVRRIRFLLYSASDLAVYEERFAFLGDENIAHD